MNVHFLVAFAEFFALCGIAALTMLTLALPARAHPLSRGASAMHPAPFAAAERLQREGRFREAVAAYDSIRESTAYRETAYAPEAVYRTAHLYRDDLHDANAAMKSYETLLFACPAIAYPHKSSVRAERADVARILDRRNSTKFLYKLVAFFVRLAGSGSRSYPCALFLISLATRVLLLPLTIRQQQEARRMERLKPQVEALQASGKDKTSGNEQIMALYRKEGIHPLLSVGLALAQTAVFLVLYQAISLYKYHFIGGTFLWIRGTYALAHPGLVADDLSEPDLPLLLCYGMAMFASQRLAMTAQSGQTSQMAFSAAVTSVLFIVWTWTSHAPAAFVLYWLISSLLATATQFSVQRLAPGIGNARLLT